MQRYKNRETGQVFACRQWRGDEKDPHAAHSASDPEKKCPKCGRSQKSHGIFGDGASKMTACPGSWIVFPETGVSPPAVYGETMFSKAFEKLPEPPSEKQGPQVTADNYVQHVLRTAHNDIEAIRERLQDPRVLDLLHASIGMGTEAGEMLDVLKKHIWYGKPIDWANVVEELGDISWYVELGCHTAQTPLQDALEKNVRKLDLRYKEGFSETRARDRDLEAERAIFEYFATSDQKADGYGTCDHCGLARPRAVLEDDGNGLCICDRCLENLAMCPTCNGQGHYIKSSDSTGTFGGTCEYCSGSGWVKKEYLCEHGEFEETCPFCHPEEEEKS